MPLRLDGEDLTLVSVQINDQAWSDYKIEGNQLVIDNLPERFTLRIVNEISPAANTALEGFTSLAWPCAPSVRPKVSATLPGILTARTCWHALQRKSSPIKPSIRSCFPTATA